MSGKRLYCLNHQCNISDCIYNLEHLDPRAFKDSTVGHLEDNPLYCKKSNWNGYQVKTEQKEITND